MSAEICTLPPPEWYCTRDGGHEGPCAAWPADEAIKMLRRELDRAKEVLESTRGLSEQRILMIEREKSRADKLQRFKDFVHRRLDSGGVPKEFPEGHHSKEGCRVGDRLDWLFEQLQLYKHARDVTAKDRDRIQAELEQEITRHQGSTRYEDDPG